MKFIMYKTVITLLILLFTTKNSNSTIISIIKTDYAMYFLSDGRSTNHFNNGIITETLSKVHPINDKYCLLTAGVYIDKFPNILKENCNKNWSIMQLAMLARDSLRSIWLTIPNHENRKAIIIIGGIDIDGQPKVIIIDSHSSQPFEIKVHYPLSQIDLTVLCNDEKTDNCTELLKKELEFQISYNKTINDEVIKATFETVIKKLSERNHSIGGNAFIEKIEIKNKAL